MTVEVLAAGVIAAVVSGVLSAWQMREFCLRLVRHGVSLEAYFSNKPPGRTDATPRMTLAGPGRSA